MQTDLLLTLFAIVAGAVSVLTPCVLVMLPAILAVTAGSGRRRVAGVLIGLELSFVGISLLGATALVALGLPPRTQEYVSVAIIAALGLVLLVPALRSRVELATSAAVNRLPGAVTAGGGDGFGGGVAGGLGLGLVWAPCAGPILAAITAGAASDGLSTRLVLMAVGFGVGMLGPLLLVLRGGHAAAARLRSRLGARRLDTAMGGAMLATALLIAAGGFTTLNREIAERVDLTSTPIAGLERRVLDRAASADLRAARAEREPGSSRPSRAELEVAGYPESHGGELVRLGTVPKLRGIQRAYNVPRGAALDAAFLRGKVVIYDFWTYSCINCLRTLPYLRELHERYADDGLVIVGVHAPEFAFERDEGNVARAIDDLGVTWPVATDPRLETWTAFHNRYWPAKYIADRDGELRYVHYGEGAYEETERVVRELLGLGPPERGLPQQRPIDYAHNTPETYLGRARLSGWQWRARVAATGEPISTIGATYELTVDADELERNEFGLVGPWRVDAERATATGPGARIVLHYRARDVYLVLDPGERDVATVRVEDAAGEGGGTRTIRVDGDRLYTLRAGEQSQSALLRVHLPPGVSAYAFTFG